MTTESTQPIQQPTLEVGPPEPTAPALPARERVPRTRAPRYDRKFKLLVVAWISRSDKGTKELAAALGLSRWVVYQWRRELGAEAAALFPDTSALADENDRIKCALKAFVASLYVLQNLFSEAKPATPKAIPSLEEMTPTILGEIRMRDVFSPDELTRFVHEAQANQHHAG